jgi:predicted N-formylglutamate amidohydrolase
MITCEHAANKIHKYKLQKKDEMFLETHWGYDIGAKDMGLDLSESSEILSIYSNFSRLIIDPNRSLLSDTLVRKYVEKDIQLEFNQEGKNIIYKS